ncbi:Arabinanase/levansucrase/invertase [Clavulina sp. PMI_390]|nr:Arabinanase/levansucrase/invertase [Clavulina sp. PMI_390]
MKVLSSLAVFLSALVPLVSASLQIIPGATWTAGGTNQHIQAHGGGIIKVGSTWYWVGENKLNGSAFQSINCYSSTDLVQWTYVGTPLTLQSSGDLGPNRVVERPKIIYNSSTGKYVMWMHIDNSSYGEAKVGVATSSSVCGSYTYLGSWQPLGFQSRDIGLFQDTDGTAYLLTEDRAHGTRIDQLTSDYLNVTSATYLFSVDYEAPAMVKTGGRYYLFASQETGWSANDNMYTTSTSLTSGWSSWTTFAPSGTDTYTSQTNFILPVTGSSTTSFIYMGDRWVSSNLMASTYVWLPLTLSGTSASLAGNYVNWIINPSTGAWTVGPSETTYEGEASTLSKGAVIVSCSGCSGGEAAGYIGGSSGGTAYFGSVSSTVSTTTTIRVKYLNGDSTQRYSSISVNGATAKIVAFVPASGDPNSSTLHVPLNSGTNTISITGYNSGWGADTDRLMVPVS